MRAGQSQIMQSFFNNKLTIKILAVFVIVLPPIRLDTRFYLSLPLHEGTDNNPSPR